MKISTKHLILALLLPLQMLFMQVIKSYPEFVEIYYSNGIYPYISSFLRIVFGWIPFSVGDILIAILFFLLIRFLFKLIQSKFKNFVPKIIHFTAFLSLLYACFYLLWGLNYYRQPLAENLQLAQKQYTTNQLVKVTHHIVKQLNDLQVQITQSDTIQVQNKYSQTAMYKLAVNGFENLAKKYPPLQYQHTSVKSSLMSLLQTYNGTAGYLNPLTGEAQVNGRIPKTGYPTTICHEMAHQIGFAAENEANFIGFLAANFNTDLYFKYASYRMAFAYCISEVRKRDRELASEIWQKVNSGIAKDFNASYAFWQAYKNPLEPFIKKGYNAYLKANNQSKGVASYNYVVDLLISYFTAFNTL